MQHGDAPETGYYLDLTTGICAPATDEYHAAAHVTTVQLVLDPAGYARLRPRLGHAVALRGTIFGEQTGHHHAPVLLVAIWPPGPTPRAHR